MLVGNTFIDATVFAVVVLCALVALVLTIMYYVGYWCTLQRMARHDFAALIPGYRLYELGRGAGMGGFTAALLAICYFGASAGSVALLLKMGYMDMLQVMADDLANGTMVGATMAAPGGWEVIVAGLMSFDIVTWAATVFFVLYAVLGLYAYYGAAKSFGHGIGYMLGLLILPSIFFCILGCSKSQVYRGPLLNSDSSVLLSRDWQKVVAARRDTFGSNAPLALSLMGLVSAACLMPLPALVFSIAALVRNRGEKLKPLAGAKSAAASVIGILGIVFAFVFVGLAIAAWGFLTSYHETIVL